MIKLIMAIVIATTLVGCHSLTVKTTSVPPTGSFGGVGGAFGSAGGGF